MSRLTGNAFRTSRIVAGPFGTRAFVHVQVSTQPASTLAVPSEVLALRQMDGFCWLSCAPSVELGEYASRNMVWLALEDTIKELERRNVTVKRKGKMVTVARTFTKLVDEDFGWKDPKAAERAGKSMMDYVIGGMDRSFKLKLFHTLHAAEAAGLSPGITSAFRDDYRQSIASGLKAASTGRIMAGAPAVAMGMACGRYRECPGRNSRPAMGFLRKALEVG